MSLELLGFQNEAIDELLDACTANPQQIVFQSCTGSGKTIVLTHFIQVYLRTRSNCVFLWLTPGKGDLEEQSKAKMDKYIHSSATSTLEDVLTAGFAAGTTYFINWERLTKKGNVALKEGERKNFYERIEEAHRSGVVFMVVVDESHQNDTGKADEVLNALDPYKIIRSSATPKTIKGATKIEVPEHRVISEGLIKKKVLINSDFPQHIEVNDEVDYLLTKAYDQQKILRSAYLAQKDEINPLILVQLENDNAELLTRVEKWFDGKGVSYDNGLLAVWLSNNAENKDCIEEADAKPVALIFKQAIATGWDCPRAQILVKLRENMSETFSIQTIGRIRRMPLAHHYGDELLDNCYIYTLDEKFVSDTKNASGSDAYDAKTLRLKMNFKDLTFQSEQQSSFGARGDDRAARLSIYNYYIHKYGLTDDYDKNKARLEAQGYTFKETMGDTTKSGAITDVAHDDFSGLNEITIEVNAKRRVLHDEYNNALYHLAIKTGFGAGDGYSRCGAIVRALFDERRLNKKLAKDKRFTLLTLSMEELYRFLINNNDLIKNDFRDALASPIMEQQLDLKAKETKTFYIPAEFVFTYDSATKNQDEAKKNVYEYYLMSAAPRSSGEKQFEKFCEQENNSVEWWYKNGDKGTEYLSIVYMDNTGKQKAFYPDYLVGVKNGDGEVLSWVVEVKGGMSATGSDDIDKYSPKKHAVLKKYCTEQKLPGGFVRFDKDSQELVICDFEHDYTDDVTDENWKLLKEVF